MNTLSELRERVEKATRTSRALDFEICLALSIVKQVDTDTQRHYSRLICPVTERHRWTEDQEKHHWFLSQAKANHPPGSDWCREAWPLTASVDAALALVERKLPGWILHMRTREVPPGKWSKVDPRPFVELNEPIKTRYGDGIGMRAQGKAETLPLAILSALLKSLEATNG